MQFDTKIAVAIRTDFEVGQFGAQHQEIRKMMRSHWLHGC
jgi:hypothetical protein